MEGCGNIHGKEIEEQDKVIINDECSIVKLNDKLIFNRVYLLSSKTYRNLILIIIIVWLIAFLISIPLNIIAGLYSLIIFLIMIIPFFIIYFLYKIRRVKWELEKESQNAFYIKVSPHYKLLKEVKFSEIEYLIYRHYKWADPALSPRTYSLYFYTGNLKEPIIYYGDEKDCENIGIVIAEFLGKSLYYDNGEWKEKII